MSDGNKGWVDNNRTLDDAEAVDVQVVVQTRDFVMTIDWEATTATEDETVAGAALGFVEETYGLAIAEIESAVVSIVRAPGERS